MEKIICPFIFDIDMEIICPFIFDIDMEKFKAGHSWLDRFKSSTYNYYVHFRL